MRNIFLRFLFSMAFYTIFSTCCFLGDEGVTSHKIRKNYQNSAGVCRNNVIFGMIIQHLVDYLPSQYACCITNTVLSVHSYLLQSLLWLFTPGKGQKVTLMGWKVTEWLFMLIIENLYILGFHMRTEVQRRQMKTLDTLIRIYNTQISYKIPLMCITLEKKEMPVSQKCFTVTILKFLQIIKARFYFKSEIIIWSQNHIL